MRLVWTASRNWTLVWGVLLIVQGLLPAAIVYLTKHLVDSIVSVVNAGSSWENIRHALFPAVLMGGVMLLLELVKSVSNWIRTGRTHSRPPQCSDPREGRRRRHRLL